MIEVYYAKSLRNVRHDVPEGGVSRDDYDKVADVPAEELEAVFREMNAVDGTELCCKLGVRSMSVGDVAVKDGVAHYCCGMGWAAVQFA